MSLKYFFTHREIHSSEIMRNVETLLLRFTFHVHFSLITPQIPLIPLSKLLHSTFKGKSAKERLEILIEKIIKLKKNSQ